MKTIRHGFSQIELLIGLLVTSLFSLMVASALGGVQSMWQEVMGANPTLAEHRLVVDMISEHIRNAQGCRVKANSMNAMAIPVATATSLTYVSDMNACTTIKYFLSGTNLMRQVNGGTPTKAAGNVTSLTFTYLQSAAYFGAWTPTMSPSNPTATELPKLSGVKMHMTTTVDGRPITSDVTIRLRNSPKKTKLDGL